MDNLITVGWREWVAIPGLCLPAIKAKIDTGARTSTLHTFSMETYSSNGVEIVRFGLHPLQRHMNPEIFCEAPVKDRRIVRDSGGHREERIIIESELHIAGYSWPVEITLTNRENMLFRMLLGRTAMTGRMLVNPEKSYLTGKELARYYKKHKIKK